MLIPGTTYENPTGHQITVYQYLDDDRRFCCIDQTNHVAFAVAPATLEHLFDEEGYEPVDERTDPSLVAPWMAYERPDGEQVLITDYNPQTRRVSYLETATHGQRTSKDVDEFRHMLEREEYTLINTSP